MLESNSTNILQLEVLVNDLSEDELKSALFLLQDYFKDDYLAVVKKDPSMQKEILKNLCVKKNEKLFFEELFGTIGRFDILRHLGSCCHVFKCKKNEYKSIRQLWKSLFEICEQLEDEDLKSLKEQFLEKSFWEDVNCAEEFFSLTFKQKKISERNLNSLRNAFSDKTVCLKIIESYEEATNYYSIRQPTETSPCGIAVIINHENFSNEDQSLPHLEKREGSKIDTEKLQNLWKCFGFKVRVYQDLDDNAVLNIMDELCCEDHSTYDAFIMCYLSHGSEKTVFASNNKEIKIDLLIDKIANKTPTLNGKPKCFFIQACQGENIQTAGCLKPLKTGDSESTDARPLDIQRKVSELHLCSPLYCDVYQVIATIPGFDMGVS
ncbi:caspase-8-like isoform X2 [Uloborus diversus]|uniref:caspase-8-like isoform X2 n=1 Tax=Uloborus diversus TaxID=327109 RepID=UPI00240A52A0|nr:caspase-8-like isoform X2 [Uloborus diversus]